MNYAISTAGRMKRIDDALQIFQSIERLGYTPDIVSFNNLIWSVGHAGRVDIARTFFNKMVKETKLRPNVYSYGALMHAYARTKGYKQALALLYKMREDGVIPNMVVFTSAMEACAAAGQFREALTVMQQVHEVGLRPDITMTNTAIKACSLAGAMKEAEELAQTLRDSSSMDLFTFHTLMMGNTKLGRHIQVLNLYDEALASNTELDGGVYSLAMLAAFNAQLYGRVPKIADAAWAAGVQLTEASYTTLIQSYGELGGTEQAVKCLDYMVQEGLKPNVISYAAAIAASRDAPELVLSILKRMRDENVEPNTILLTSAINALARGRDNYTRTSNTISRLTDFYRCRLNVLILMLFALIVEICFDILSEMEQNGPEPNIYTYNTIVRAFAEVGRLDEALAMLDKIKQKRLSPDQYTFTTLLIACGRTNSSDKVDYVMGMMKDSGVLPDEIAFGAALDAHRRAKDSLSALTCLQEMMRLDLEPAPIHYNLVMRTLKAEGFTDKMYKMAMVMSAKGGAKVNSNTFELVIEALLEDGKWAETLHIIAEMEKQGFKPSTVSCVSLISLLEKDRQYRAALAMYRYMLKQGYHFYENDLLNEIFKRLVSVASLSGGVAAVKGDLKNTVEGEKANILMSGSEKTPLELLQEAISST